MKTLLVTGSSGLIGSAVCRHFGLHGWNIHGVDNNGRATFFGPPGDTRWNQRRLLEEVKNFQHHELDIRNRGDVLNLVETLRPHAIVHAAAQPSHDLSAQIPFDDFDTNAVGTLNVLEATRRHSPEAAFIYLSSNKVYGDAPNELPLSENETRWDFSRPQDFGGISEEMRIDRTKHSLFGASKVAADVMVQEYGRYFGMRTCCLRGGCLTGPDHAAVELHGFLSYLIRCNIKGETYKVFGFKGKQVRDNIHATDVARFIHAFVLAPRSGEVYNLGGGRDNSCSILEAFALAEGVSGRKMRYKYLEETRPGDHICYISDLTKCRSHHPTWDLTFNLQDIFEQCYASWTRRLGT